MDRSVRSSSAPLSGTTVMDGQFAAHTSETGANEKTMLPRSPGYFPSENSVSRLEFQDSKRSIDELKELARTAPPDRMATKPSFTSSKATDLVRADSGRRRRILEQIGGSDSHPQKPLRRLFRLDRSATTSDLSGNGIPRGSMEITTKHSSSGRKYLKIAINPKMYELDNPSTYKINYEDLKAKSKPPKWIYRKSQTKTDVDCDAVTRTGHISHASSEKQHAEKVMEEFPRLILGSEIYNPAKSVTNLASNGYSPSKGIPKVPEHGLQDFTAATLATAQARARAGSSGHLFRSPERPGAQSRLRESPIRKYGHNFARRRVSSKGPHSVPFKFQLRPQRAFLPKTPRTSLDGLAAACKDSSPPPRPDVIKSAVPQSVSSSPISPIESSPAKSGRSGIDEYQSDAESGKIMNAQRAEFIHGQGAYAYHHSSSSRQPPKPGPAPTRALPSLPEGHDGGTPKSVIAGKTPEKQNMVLSSELASGCGSSPKQKQQHPPKSSPPKKGHRYRLSPVKNTVPSESHVLKPSPTFTEVFPQPPTNNNNHNSTLLARKSSEAISPRTRIQNREYDASTLMTTARGMGMSTSSLTNLNSAVGAIPRPSIDGLNNSDGPPSSSSAKDAEKDSLYMPWHESRAERVRELKIKDLERFRARQGSSDTHPQQNDEDTKNSQKTSISSSEKDDRGGSMSTDVAGKEIKHAPRTSSLSANRIEHRPVHLSSSEKKEDRLSVNSAKNAFSRIVTVAEQPPCSATATTTANGGDERQYTHRSQKNGDSYESSFSSSISAAVERANGQYLHPSQNNNHHNNINNTSHPPLDHKHSLTPTYNIHPSSPSLSASTYRPLSPQSNQHSTISDLEIRLAAMEKKNMLLERAFLAVIDASSGFAGGAFGGSGSSGRGSGYLGDEGRERERERISGVSEGDGLGKRVDEMLGFVGGVGREG
ncbi:MAG: hypothetical protein Q9169_002083 [Polycauliona sp. 2 TL-2023]